MGKEKIIEKLEVLLKKQPFTEECQVLYLMVEIRKILDHKYDKKNDFKLLRFFCDWLVHTEKDRNLKHIIPVLQSLYEHAKKHIETNLVNEGVMVDFLYMKELQNELNLLFACESIPIDLCSNNEYWTSFVKLMTCILSDQPIRCGKDDATDVSRFSFSSESSGKVEGEIYFKKPISNIHYYLFWNTY